MNLLDEEYTKHPFYGARRMKQFLRGKGYLVGRKHISSLLRKMGLETIFPKSNLSWANSQDKIYPYLLRDVDIKEPNQVWSADITYIRLTEGFVYLMAIIDWYSRYVLSWRISNTLESDFCVEALNEALVKYGNPAIFNSDQGSQFTSHDFTQKLLDKKVRISMDGKGRAYDNIFVERLWRSVKYENIYICEYRNIFEVREGLDKYLKFYNEERYHQSLNYKTPAEIYRSERRAVDIFLEKDSKLSGCKNIERGVLF